MSIWKKGSLFACEICGHHIEKHTPKCAVKSCQCHYDPDAYPQFYVVRRTLYEIFTAQDTAQDKARKYLWALGPDGARWPLYVVTGYKTVKVHMMGKKVLNVKRTLSRPVTEREEKMFRRIIKMEETKCKKLATRIHNVLYRNGDVLPEPARYICDYALEKTPKVSDSHTKSRPDQIAVTEAYPQRTEKSIGKNTKEMKGKRFKPIPLADYIMGRTKRNPGQPYGIRVVRSLKEALTKQVKHPLLSKTIRPCGCVIRKHAGGFTFYDKCKQHGGKTSKTYPCSKCGREFLHRQDMKAHRWKEHVM